MYTSLYRYAKAITDYTENEENEENEEETDIALEFQDNDSDEDDNQYVIKDESEDEDEEGDEGTSNKETLREGRLDDDELGDDLEDQNALDPRDIDAFWIQKKVSEFEKYEITKQKLAREILEILKNSVQNKANNEDDMMDEDDENNDLIECENELVSLLGVEHYKGFIKLLLNNREKVVYCTLLKQAQNEDEKQKIRKEMLAKPSLNSILDVIEGRSKYKAHKASAHSSILREARRLKEEEEVAEASKDTHFANQRKMIDIDALAFQHSGHLMSNKTCKLPENSKRIERKGYEEVFIPGTKKPIDPNEKFVPIKDLPEWARRPFGKIEKLNRIQSKIFESAFYGADNILICAPTGAGKTNCALLTILHEIGLNRFNNGEIDLSSFKIVYIAPMKSLVREMVEEFQSRLECYNIQVRELSGDINLTKQQISETQMIVTTPEKWDIVTRKSGDRTYTQLCRLIIIDEIHLLHDERGPVLESIVARTIRQIEQTQEMVRIVGLSATLPNYEDVATFCRVKPENLFAFENSYRPVPLEQHYIGITEKKPMKRFQVMNDVTFEKVIEHSERNQVLIFVHSRKETIKTARYLRDRALSEEKIGNFLKGRQSSSDELQKVADSAEVTSADLKDLLPYGFAIHHAGLTRYDRNIVEDLFKLNHIRVLVSTATLAWGVNLPAYCVIIKGTQVYNPEKGAWTELSAMDIMQMLGRAGRPQFDTKGEGVIITSHSELQYYLSLMNNQLPIESQFMTRLIDHLNAEIVMGAVQNVREAADWLGYTYLFVCMLRSPTLYGISYSEYEDDPELLGRRLNLIHSAAMVLDKDHLIKYDKKNGEFQVTNLGRVASHFYISHRTISVYNEHLKPTMSDIDLFRLFSLSEEFKYITVRQEEKIELEKLLERVPIPVKESVDEPSAKVNVLLQSYISRLKLEGFALVSDMIYVQQSAARLMRALYEIVLRRGWAQLSDKILNLTKMIQKRMWGSQSPLRQFPSILPAVIKRIEASNKLSFERLFDLNSQEIGELVLRKDLGKKIFQCVHQFPRVDLSAYVQPITSTVLKVDLTITPNFEFPQNNSNQYGASDRDPSFLQGRSSEVFWIFVEDVDGEKLLYYEYFILKEKYVQDDHFLSFTVELTTPLPPQYFIRIISDRWIGSESVLPISFRNLILPSETPYITERLDLQPIAISTLKNTSYQNFYSFTYLNGIQTQVFHSFYNTSDNILLAAPTGSGKTLCAELSVFKELNKSSEDSKIVYIAPVEAIAIERFIDWETKFGEGALGLEVVLLTGDLNVDLKLLAKGKIIISTPDHWDVISRRWMQRKNVQNVSLFIVDEIHFIGTNAGHIIEAIVSRMRYIAQQMSKKIRIIALSTSLSNAKSLGEWLGATPKNIFNFHPNARPVPLEIHLKGFDETHFEYRMMAMTKPALLAISHQSNGKPTILFTPSRKHLLQIANDIRTYCDASESPLQFLHCTPADLAPYLPQIQNKFLKDLLGYGIAIYHENLSDIEKEIVQQLFKAEAIQILIATRNMCWGMDLYCYLTIIMGTEYYDGKDHRYSDYPIADLLQMMGRASRQSIDHINKCVILCPANKRDFYKKFLFEPLPIESHFDTFFADHLNAEIFTKIIQDTQDAMDYLSWTFLFRRFTQNPNYYNLHGTSHRHLCDHLSELVESSIQQLEEAGCISKEVEEDGSVKVSSLNPGMIAAFYYLHYTTIEIFATSIGKNTKLKGLLEILCSAKEFADIPIRHKEPGILRKLAGHLPIKIDSSKFNDPAVKANILLQSHFARLQLSSELRSDQIFVLKNSIKLIQAMVDVISSFGALKPALVAMELAQMIVQAMWPHDSIFKQLPYFNDEVIGRLKKEKVERIEELLELDDQKRNQLLQLNDKQMSQVAIVCNKYPDVDVDFEVQSADNILASEPITIVVQLQKNEEDNDEEEDGNSEENEEKLFVHAPFYPKAVLEGWWVIVGDLENNSLLAMKRVSFQRSTTAQTTLSFNAPKVAGKYRYRLYVLCDSYMGCDQEYPLDLNVAKNDEEDEEVDQGDDNNNENNKDKDVEMDE